MKPTFQVLSALLQYPQQALLDALPEIHAALAADVGTAATVQPLLQYFEQNTLLVLQENYVATFDRNPKHSLHLFEHIHGESRDRGPAMVDLMEEYKRGGFDMVTSELPDYVPLFLEFLSQVSADEAQRLLGDAIHVLALIGDKLAKNGSPYAVALNALRALTPVVPQPLTEPPIRDMDEAMVQFGVSNDGSEPLMSAPRAAAVQPVKFYPRPVAA